MTFFILTILIMTVAIGVAYKVSAVLDMDLSPVALAGCGVLALVINFSSILLTPFLTSSRFYVLGGLVLTAAAILTGCNQYINNRKRPAMAVASTKKSESVVGSISDLEPSLSETNMLLEASVPAGEDLPTEEEHFPKEDMPDEEEHLIADNVPVENESSIEEDVPDGEAFLIEEHLTEEAIPAEEEPLVGEAIPDEKEHLTEEDIHTGEESLVEEHVPDEEESLTEEDVPTEEDPLTEEDVPAEEESLIEEHVPDEEESLTEEDVPAEEESLIKENELSEEILPAVVAAPADADEPADAGVLVEDDMPQKDNHLVTEAAATDDFPLSDGSLSLDELLDRAFDYMQENKPELAIRVYEYALEIYRDDSYAPFVAIEISNLYRATGEYGKAAANYRRYMTLPAVLKNADIEQAFQSNCIFLERLQEALEEAGMPHVAYRDIPKSILSAISSD